jgi:hypothetical protein
MPTFLYSGPNLSIKVTLSCGMIRANILHQAEFLRYASKGFIGFFGNTTCIRADFGNSQSTLTVLSDSSPMLTVGTLYLRGELKEFDNEVMEFSVTRIRDCGTTVAKYLAILKNTVEYVNTIVPPEMED